jgi:hypothetical protein
VTDRHRLSHPVGRARARSPLVSPIPAVAALQLSAAPSGIRRPGQTVDEDVKQAQHAGLPPGLVMQVAHAYQRPQEVRGADIGTDFA